MQSGANAGDPNGTPSLSFAPVGLDLAPMDEDDDEHAIDITVSDDAASLRLPKPRSRRFARSTWGAICAGTILAVAAALALSSRRNAAANAAPVALNGAGTIAAPPAANSPRVDPPITPAAAPAVAETPSTGTLRLRRPASAGHVWLDGRKLMAGSSLVSCGAHQIKVGARARPRAIDVPCGAEMEITR